MQDPGSTPKNTRICPGCKRPVPPGFKFCETCGTRIPVLSTCSKCGTQFITPVKYCDLCGAPVILAVPEPDGSPETVDEETGPVNVQATEHDDEEIPVPDDDISPEDSDGEQSVTAEDERLRGRKKKAREPDAEEVPESYDKDDDVAAIVESSLPSGSRSLEKHNVKKEKTSHRYPDEIREPDTEDLLNTYGREYDVNETLESSRKSVSRSRTEPDRGKPFASRASTGRESPGTVDDALLMSPEKPDAPEKPRRGKATIIGGCIVLVALIAVVYFIGLPMLAGSGGVDLFSSQPAVEITPLPAPTANRTVTPTPSVTPTRASKALVPQTTQTIPSGQKLYFHVQKSPITAKILITFTGSAGHGSIESADIRVTQPDGSVSTGMIQPLKGITEVILQGSKETDRVEIIALMSDGGTYRVYDQLVPFET